jgi:PGF-CTERM protein
MQRNEWRRLVGVLLCVLVLSATTAPAAAASHDDERFRVALDTEGNADVSVTYAYDLETDGERAAFEELASNETARQRLATRFENRMGAVADGASSETGRDMTVGDATVETADDDGVGTVTLSVRWENLAAVNGDRLTVTEPFASGFEPDRRFVVEAPDGYAVASATPAPSASDDGRASWAAGSSLSGFELVATADDAGDGSTGDGAGFGSLLALAALAGAALLARRHGP